MLNNGNNIACDFADEIVSYIYDEATVAERSKFERHLSACAPCTDEFAAISEARFAVFEWQREEFAPLATPPIRIPYGVEQIGFVASVRRWFTIPAMSAAAALLLLSLGVAYVSLRNTSSLDVAANVSPAKPGNNLPAVAREARIDETQPDIASAREDEIQSPPTAVRPKGAESDQQKSTSRRIDSKVRPAPIRSTTANNAIRSNRAPSLATYQDTEDKSLRLTDLFADDGGRSDK